MRRAIAILAAALAVAACGKQDTLKPRAGVPLPPRPAMAASQPTPDALLAPTTVARPTRGDELLTKSKLRPDDRFDLPPPG